MMQQNKFTSQEIMMQAIVHMCIYPLDGEAINIPISNP